MRLRYDCTGHAQDGGEDTETMCDVHRFGTGGPAQDPVMAGPPVALLDANVMQNMLGLKPPSEVMCPCSD